MRKIKNVIREILIYLHIDLTKNLEYDRLTKRILKKYLLKDYNCIDVGCHKGEILDVIIKYSPNGKHYGFEPIPYLFKELEHKYKKKATILPYALFDRNGTTTFQFVKNAPAYSGIKKRSYNISKPEIEEIKVEMKRLDDVLSKNEKIHFIKIDVEGGEFGVLKGGEKLLKRNKPLIIFEFGKGASDFYGTKPEELFKFMSVEIGLKIYTLQSYLKNKKPLNVEEFINHFEKNDEYYFIAK